MSAQWFTPRALERVAAVCVIGAAALLVWPARVTITPASRPEPTLLASAASAAAPDLNALVANNPFSPTRRAPTQRFVAPGAEPAPVPDAAMTSAPEASSSTVSDAPQLLGVLRVDGAARALVQIAADSAPRLVGLGARIGRWRVDAIDRTQITLLSAAGSRIVRLARPTLPDSSPPRP